MKKFEFRLEHVLEYRRLSEADAKDTYLRARHDTLEAEAHLKDIRLRRSSVVHGEAKTLLQLMAIESCIQWIDEEEQMQQSAIAVLRDEELAAMERWQDKRKEVRLLERLRDEAVTAWQYAVNQEETKALDEWTTTARKVPA